ncbi:MAG: response regulator [Candidatus Methylomirabilales bacterium]
MGKKANLRIVIADDHRLFREGLIALLLGEENLVVAGEAATGPDVLRVVEEIRPDVLLLDLFMPDLGGPEVLPKIRDRSPATKVLLLTNKFDQEPVFRALWEGARGYLQKSASSEELLKAIRVVHAGEAWIERSVMSHLLEEFPRQEERMVRRRGRSVGLLSKREAEVARFVAEGLSNKEVANRLAISEKTVKSHLASIFRKLQLRHRLQLALYTLQRESSPDDRSEPE